LPKGTVKPGISVSAAAATEAFEEAGVLGTIEDKEIFSYRDTKSLTKGGKLDVRVVVHVMMVSSEAPIWPEMHERERRWLEPEAALQVLIGKYLKGSVRAFLKHKQFSSEP
jgi:8-oxo-dGTP pyrophosphatase MutT (NUDIX family)